MTQDALSDELARALFDKMEHLDPTGATWADTTEEERNFCRSCINAIAPRLRAMGMREAFGIAVDNGDLNAILARAQELDPQ